MIVWFYRAEALKATSAAIEKYPALTLKHEHPSLVMFKREFMNDAHPSVILLNNYHALRELACEIHFARSTYGEAAIDIFGDTWTWEELREMLKRSEYAYKDVVGINEGMYSIKGKFADLNLDDIAKTKAKEDQDKEEEDLLNKQAAPIAAAIGMDHSIAVRLVKAGFGSVHVFQGMTTDDLTVGGAFGLDEATIILERAKSANLL